MSQIPQNDDGADATAPSAVMPARRRLETAGICAVLAILVFIAFGQTVHFAFINFDDDVYVYENAAVASGISPASVQWALTHSTLHLWTPLTTISHMVDCQIFGLNPGGHHLVNVLLHLSTAVALFLVLRQMTGAQWRSAFVAAVFAIHPLHVESVAWISERKDVLCAFFFMLTLGAYVRYVRGPSAMRYLTVALLLAAALLAKQMAMTLPFVLLVLDYWPLNRFTQTPGGGGGMRVFSRLLIEKIPLFALSMASCAQVFVEGAQSAVNNAPVAHTSLLRVANALVTYFVYIGQTFYPVKLVVVYPFPAAVPAWQAAGALALLAGITAAAFLLRRKYPALLTGWLWYAGMLVPVAGFLRLGQEAHADRYTYLPQIGLAIAVTWLVAEGCARLRLNRALPAIAGAVLCVLLVAATRQAAHWRDNQALWSRALEYTHGNFVANNHLGAALAVEGRTEDAVAQYREALRLNPDYPDALYNLGTAMFQLGQTEEAIAQFHRALQLNPNYAAVHGNLGTALAKQGKTEEAIAQYREALRLNPGSADTSGNLGKLLFQLGRTEEAVEQLRDAAMLDPGNAATHDTLAKALLIQENVGEAITHAEKALALDPDNASYQNNLAWILASAPDAKLRNGQRGLELALKANQASGGSNVMFLHTLAAAYAETRQFPDAVKTAKSALQLAGAQSNPALSDALREEIKIYESGHSLQNAQ